MTRETSIFAMPDEFQSVVDQLSEEHGFFLWKDVAGRGASLERIRVFESNQNAWFGPDPGSDRRWTPEELCTELSFVVLEAPRWNSSAKELLFASMTTAHEFTDRHSVFKLTKKAFLKLAIGKVTVHSANDVARDSTNIRYSSDALESWKNGATFRQVSNSPGFFRPVIE